MIRAALLALCVFGGLTGMTAPARAGVADEAMAAASALQEAVAALEAAEEAQDRISALSETIRAYERGLAAMRAAQRQVEAREAELTQRFELRRERLMQLLGTLSALDPQVGPLMLLHPDGALGTVRSGMLMADVTPDLKAEVDLVAADLTELADLRAFQRLAGQTLQAGLERASTARVQLSKAMSDRTDLPRRYTEDPAALQELLANVDTLADLAGGLNLDAYQGAGFEAAKGTLDLPVLGQVILTPGETDARGVVRPGLTLACRPLALVSAPWEATIRYAGPLLDYGNVIILEPGDGYLLIMAGLDRLFGQVGEIVTRGAPLGMMGGAEQAGTGGTQAANGSGAGRTETLYLELRQGAQTVDPRDWFALTGDN